MIVMHTEMGNGVDDRAQEAFLLVPTAQEIAAQIIDAEPAGRQEPGEPFQQRDHVVAVRVRLHRRERAKLEAMGFGPEDFERDACGVGCVVAIDGQQVESWDDMARIISTSNGGTLRITLQREQERFEAEVTPKLTVRAGYNYAEKNYSDDDGGWAKTYISLHGHYAYMNLFEGNTVQEIDVADYWGPCGPGNTFLRNRVESEGIQIMDHSHYQNVIGKDADTALAKRPESAGLPLDREPYRSLLLQARQLNRRPRHLGIHAGENRAAGTGTEGAGRPARRRGVSEEGLDRNFRIRAAGERTRVLPETEGLAGRRRRRHVDLPGIGMLRANIKSPNVTSQPASTSAFAMP